MQAPEYFYVHDPTEKVASASAVGEHFAVDDLLDFSNEDDATPDQGYAVANSSDSYTITTRAAVESCNSSFSGDNAGSSYSQVNEDSGGFYGSSNLSSELCVPYDDVAELEWLSNFVEDSFSANQPSLSLHFIPTADPSKSQTPDASSTNALTSYCPPPNIDSSSVFLPLHSPLRSKSRSKRPRAVPCDWTTRLLHLTADDEPPPRASSSKRDGNGGTGMGMDMAPRRCLHCAAEKTPQWRTGPMGPKTLCNACGVRYKSGRLVPEYRPAASPTFLSAKHSNSHRKVLELRRQKDMQRVHPYPQPHPHSQFVSPSPTFGSGDPEYLIGEPRFRHVI